MKNKLYFICVLLFTIFAIANMQETLASQTISVQQIISDQGMHTYTKTCELNENPCHLFIGIQEENSTQNIDIDAGVFFRDEGAYIQFKHNFDYFIISEKPSKAPLNQKLFFIPFNDKKQARKRLELFKTSKMEKKDPEHTLLKPLVVRPKKRKIAALEIKITAENK